jgi:hypothetical protein
MGKKRDFTSIRSSSKKPAPRGRLEQELTRCGIEITHEFTDKQVAAWLAALRSRFPERDSGECSNVYKRADGEIPMRSGAVLTSSEGPNVDKTHLLSIETHFHSPSQEGDAARARHCQYTTAVDDMTDGILSDDGISNGGFEAGIAYSDEERDVYPKPMSTTSYISPEDKYYDACGQDIPYTSQAWSNEQRITNNLLWDVD